MNMDKISENLIECIRNSESVDKEIKEKIIELISQDERERAVELTLQAFGIGC